MKGNKHIFYALVFLSSWSIRCTDGPRTLSEYKDWFYETKNGFIEEKKIGGLILNVVYTPTEYLVSKELEENKHYSKKKIEEIRQSYKGGKNFILQIGIDSEKEFDGDELLASKVKSFEEWKTLIEELSFGIKENVKLIADSDTLSPSMYHFERGYELGQQQRFLFSFPSDKNYQKMSLRFDDEHFHTGRSYFNFSDKKDIPQLPIVIKDDEIN